MSTATLEPGLGSPNSVSSVYLGPGWTLVGHLAGVDQDLLRIARTPLGDGWALTAEAAEARRLLTIADPLLFAYIYLQKHLRFRDGDPVSFSRFHLALAEAALRWIRNDLGSTGLREAWIAPRGSGKSTWTFAILPLWLLAHEHRRYIAAFADSGPQAQQHLISIKRELDTNPLLRYDFPLLCRPALRPGGVNVTDSQSLMLTESGAVFQAKGIDASTLGAKLGSQRPDMILFDDIEPSANYSPYQKEKRQDTIVDAVFPMAAPSAVIVFAGTTTMYGSVIHDIVRTVTDPGDAPQWVQDERIEARYFPAIITRDDGSEASLWPERWPLEDLQARRHTRSFALNMDNRPVSAGGTYWGPEDFRYGELPAVTRRVLSVDPATTSRETSDATGLAIVGWDPNEGRCVVEYAAGVRLSPTALRAHIVGLLSAHPGVQAVCVETNQGGDTWAQVLAPLPVKLVTVHQHEPKPVRAARALDWYQTGWVLHADRTCARAFEREALAFPGGAHDDVLDAVCTGLNVFLGDRKRGRRSRPRDRAYV